MANIYNKRESKERRRELRQSQTRTEFLLWKALRGNNLGVRFRRQFGIGRYAVDFYAPSCRLVIEIDGSIHSVAEVQANDIDRQLKLEALGLHILRFTADEITGNIEAVLARIRLALQNPLLTKERAG